MNNKYDFQRLKRVKREIGENPMRARHCEWGRKPREATGVFHGREGAVSRKIHKPGDLLKIRCTAFEEKGRVRTVRGEKGYPWTGVYQFRDFYLETILFGNDQGRGP